MVSVRLEIHHHRAADGPERAEHGGGGDLAALRATVLELIAQAARPPAHVAALSLAYKQRTGRSIKLDFKGGMLKFIRAELASETVVMGEGNDSFVRVATPTTRAMQWRPAGEGALPDRMVAQGPRVELN